MEIYKTTGVCATEIHFEVENNHIKEISFVKGCPGNVIGISALIQGMEINEAIKRLKGIKCGSKQTSCPDQLAQALETYKQKQN
jgi:uncharacterized protein (TIGR03905 family)